MMAVTEAQTLDMSAILMQAYDLGDMIKVPLRQRSFYIGSSGLIRIHR